MAEVKLVWPFDEVDGRRRRSSRSARRLTRAGDADYRLNGAACRLLDVQEALSARGLGPDSLAVIRQGQVEALCTSTPAERRAIVDAAAGRRRGQAPAAPRRAEAGAAWPSGSTGPATSPGSFAAARGRSSARRGPPSGRRRWSARWRRARRAWAPRGPRAAAEALSRARAEPSGSARPRPRTPRPSPRRAPRARPSRATGARRPRTPSRRRRPSPPRLRRAAERVGGRAELAAERLAEAVESARERARAAPRAAARAAGRRSGRRRGRRGGRGRRRGRRRAGRGGRRRGRGAGPPGAGAITGCGRTRRRPPRGRCPRPCATGTRPAARAEDAVPPPRSWPCVPRRRMRTRTGPRRAPRGGGRGPGGAPGRAGGARRAARRPTPRPSGRWPSSGRARRGAAARALAPRRGGRSRRGRRWARAWRSSPGMERAVAAALGALAERRSPATTLRRGARRPRGRGVLGRGRPAPAAARRRRRPEPGRCGASCAPAPDAARPHLERLLADAWLVDRLEDVPPGPPGVAVTAEGMPSAPADGLVTHAEGGWARRALHRRAVGGRGGPPRRGRRSPEAAVASAPRPTRARPPRAGAGPPSARPRAPPTRLAAARADAGAPAAEPLEAAAGRARAAGGRRGRPRRGPRGGRRAPRAGAAAGPDGRGGRRRRPGGGRGGRARRCRGARREAVDARAALAARPAPSAPRPARAAAATEAVARGTRRGRADLEPARSAAEALAEAAARPGPAPRPGPRAGRGRPAPGPRRRGRAAVGRTRPSRRAELAAAASAETAHARRGGRGRGRRARRRGRAAARSAGEERRRPRGGRRAGRGARGAGARQLGAVNPLAAAEREELGEREAEMPAQIDDLEAAAAALRAHLGELDAAVAEGFDAIFERRLGRASPRSAGCSSRGARAACAPWPTRTGRPGIEVEVVPGGQAAAVADADVGGRAVPGRAGLLPGARDGAPGAVLPARRGRGGPRRRQPATLPVGRHAASPRRTQFLLITHQQPTVEIADTLFGVTMGREGVSQVVARRLRRDGRGPGAAVRAPARCARSRAAAPGEPARGPIRTARRGRSSSSWPRPRRRTRRTPRRRGLLRPPAGEPDQAAPDDLAPARRHLRAARWSPPRPGTSWRRRSSPPTAAWTPASTWWRSCAARPSRAASPAAPTCRGPCGGRWPREMAPEPARIPLDGEPTVILIVGVNGSGKTTTIGKLAHRLAELDQKVVIGAADTFRAAADRPARGLGRARRRPARAPGARAPTPAPWPTTRWPSAQGARRRRGAGRHRRPAPDRSTT